MQETLDVYLNILDCCHAVATAAAIEALVDKFVCVPIFNDWFLQRSATICKRKLLMIRNKVTASDNATTNITVSDAADIYGQLPDIQYNRIAVYCEQHKSNQMSVKSIYSYIYVIFYIVALCSLRVLHAHIHNPFVI